MKKYLVNYSSLCAKVLCLFIALTTQVYAAKWATIVSDRAIVYSDLQMSSEIGFIAKGKKVRIGEVLRNKGRLVPVIVNGKVAYIKVADIQSNANLVALQTATERIKSKMDEKVDEKRIAILGQSLISNIDFGKDFGSIRSENYTFYGGGVRGYYKNIQTGVGYRSTINYFTTSKDDLTYTYLGFEVDGLFSFNKNKYFDLSFFSGLILVPYSQIKYSSYFTINGYGLGGQVGADMRISIGSKLSLHLDSSYQMIKLFGYSLPENPDFPDDVSPLMNAVKFGLALSYEI